MDEFTGVYARNESGAYYVEWFHSAKGRRLPDVAYLTDLSVHAVWEINYKLKNFHRIALELADYPDLSAGPMTWQAFLISHGKDLSLGRKRLSGMDCVAYRIRSDTAQKIFWKEFWYAPALNFVLVRQQYLSPGGELTIRVMKDIRIGQPDPNLFHIPEGFSVVH